SPVIAYFSDAFKKPCRFEPHIAVDIEPELDRLVGMLDCHASQFYEWLPYNAGHPEQVPNDATFRRAWLADRMRARLRPLADQYRERVVRVYGAEKGARVRYIEAFEVSEFGAPLDPETWTRLFPFLPAESSACSPFTRKEWVDVPSEG